MRRQEKFEVFDGGCVRIRRKKGIIVAIVVAVLLLGGAAGCFFVKSGEKTEGAMMAGTETQAAQGTAKQDAHGKAEAATTKSTTAKAATKEKTAKDAQDGAEEELTVGSMILQLIAALAPSIGLIVATWMISRSIKRMVQEMMYSRRW